MREQSAHRSWTGQTKLLGCGEELVHHLGELGLLDDAVLVGVVVSEDLQHVPVELHVLRPGHLTQGGLDEGLVLPGITGVDDGVGLHGLGLGQDVLLAELQPLIEGDDSGGFLGGITQELVENLSKQGSRVVFSRPGREPGRETSGGQAMLLRVIRDLVFANAAAHN